jgi:hypothetical protein
MGPLSSFSARRNAGPAAAGARMDSADKAGCRPPAGARLDSPESCHRHAGARSPSVPRHVPTGCRARGGVLRPRGDRLYPVIPDGHRHSGRTGRTTPADCRRNRRRAITVCARVAVAAITGQLSISGASSVGLLEENMDGASMKVDGRPGASARRRYLMAAGNRKTRRSAGLRQRCQLMTSKTDGTVGW